MIYWRNILWNVTVYQWQKLKYFIEKKKYKRFKQFTFSYKRFSTSKQKKAFENKLRNALKNTNFIKPLEK